MPIHKKKDWSIAEKEATDEDVYMNRRRILTALGIGGVILAAPLAFRTMQDLMPTAEPLPPPEPDPSAGLYPVERNPAYTLDRALSPEQDVISYNNFYEFGSHKSIASAAQALRIRPWQVRLDGLVETERTVDIDDLLKAMPLEERLYRHRCVEAWSMAVPWSGFALKSLLDYAQPLGSAKYVVMETFHDPDMAPGQGGSLVSLALRRSPDHRGGGERARLHRHRPLRQAHPSPEWCSAAPRRTLEIWLQIDQVDRPFFVHGDKTEDLLGGDPARRVRLLGERQSGRFRIRAGARRASVCSAAASAFRPFSTTAMPSRWRISTRICRTSVCSLSAVRLTTPRCSRFRVGRSARIPRQARRSPLAALPFRLLMAS